MADSSLPAIAEDVDEGAALAGEVATIFTQEEKDAVRRKLDRRVSLSFLAIHFLPLVSCSPLLAIRTFSCVSRDSHCVTTCLKVGLYADYSASSSGRPYPRGCLLLPVSR